MKYPEYDSPFEMNISDMTTQMARNIDEMSWQALQRVGINVDKDKLLIALRQDSERYREAYAKGYDTGYDTGYEKRDDDIVRCKDCKYYKIEECWEDMGHGVKMKAGRYEAICTKWANGTDSDGYCFRAELLD